MRNKSIPLPNKINQQIASVFNRVLCYQKAPANIKIMKVKRNITGPNIAITLYNAMVAIALAYCNDIINTAHTVEKGVLDVEEHKLWETLKVHAVPLVRNMGKATKGLHKMPDKIHAEKEGVVIQVEV